MDETTDEPTVPATEIEYDRLRCRIVRKTDNRVLIEVLWSDDTMVEQVADTLSKFGQRSQADRVRELKAGCRA